MSTIVSIVVQKNYALICRSKNKRHNNFVFNDNSDNDWQFLWYSWVQHTILHILLLNIVNIVVQKTRGLIILYLTTIVTMIDNFYDIHECNIQSCISYCRPLSNIVVLKNKGLDNFVFNDNSDKDWQYYKSCVQWTKCDNMILWG